MYAVIDKASESKAWIEVWSKSVSKKNKLIDLFSYLQ